MIRYEIWGKLFNGEKPVNYWEFMKFNGFWGIENLKKCRSVEVKKFKFEHFMGFNYFYEIEIKVWKFT